MLKRIFCHKIYALVISQIFDPWCIVPFKCHAYYVQISVNPDTSTLQNTNETHDWFQPVLPKSFPTSRILFQAKHGLPRAYFDDAVCVLVVIPIIFDFDCINFCKWYHILFWLEQSYFRIKTLFCKSMLIRMTTNVCSSQPNHADWSYDFGNASFTREFIKTHMPIFTLNVVNFHSC